MRLTSTAAVAVAVWTSNAWLSRSFEVTVNSDASAAGMFCEADSQGPICFGDNKESVILPPALPKGIVGYWSFDDSIALDVSGNHLHGSNPSEAILQAGPSFAGQGSSAHLGRGKFMSVKHNAVLNAKKDFSYTFWLNLLDDPASLTGVRYCPILTKGGSAMPGQDSSAPSTPAVKIDRKTRNINIEIGTEGGALGATVDLGTEAFTSNAKLAPGRWYHIAVVHIANQRRTRLYVNGILDASQMTKGFAVLNDKPLYVGGDPATATDCHVPMYMDELKIYSRSLDHDEIQAEAAPSLAGVEPSFVRLACVDCPLIFAIQNCPQAYHICNTLELHMGGYQVARTLGWMQRGTHVWSHASSVAPTAFTAASLLQEAPAPAPEGAAPTSQLLEAAPSLGLGLCCADSA